MTTNLFEMFPVTDVPDEETPVGTATFSECGRYRYLLGRNWGTEAPMLFIMLNPSTADADEPDPTIRKCVGFAKKHGCGGIVVVNLYAWKSTDPAGLKKAADPVGPDNDKHICAMLHVADWDKVVVAWGANARDESRIDSILKLIRLHGKKPLCFGKTNGGQPLHPLMLAYETPLVEFVK